MTAWSYMQFAEMTEEEREDIQHALKKYCELDTLAVAFIMEYFLIELKRHENNQVWLFVRGRGLHR